MPCIEGNQHENGFDVCDFLEKLSTKSTPFLIHILFVPALVIIFLTLIDRYTEDAKWFMFNTAVINIITGISWELKRVKSLERYMRYINLVWSMGKDVSHYSIFFLAGTRLFIFYWPMAYKKIFARKFLLLWIIVCDALLAGLSHLVNGSGVTVNATIYITMEIVVLFGTFGCSLFVLLKIRKLKILVGHSTQLDLYGNLQRASYVCLFQSFFYTIYTALLIYMNLYGMRIITSEPPTPIIMRVLLRILSQLKNPMFLLFTIIDTLIPMILLRSYRRTIKNLFLSPYRCIFSHKTETAIATTNLMPRINNLVA